MGGNARRRSSEPGRPLSMRAVVLGGVLVGVVGAVAITVLLYFYGGGTARDRAGLDLVRTAGTLVVGTGGAMALLLAARRQRSTELTLEHQREVAVEQRITELYTHAVDQLGNSQAPVRLGGLYALERLAQNNPVQRQTIVDVICAYLRMPYDLPKDKPPHEDAAADAHTRYEQRRQELQVRLTAQRILAAHLKPDAVDTFWPDMDLDLTETHLHQLDLTNCHMRHAHFNGAEFFGVAWFAGAEFFGVAWFAGAKFSWDAWFDRAEFFGDAWFAGAKFSGVVVFVGAEFSGNVVFGGAMFSKGAKFEKTEFTKGADCSGARARPAEDRPHSWPVPWTTRGAREGEEEGWLYLVRMEGRRPSAG
jgi:Pentapeptide repeats (8 copies)